PVDVVNSHSSTDSWLAALACATLARAPALVRTRHISASIPNNLPTRWLYRSATRHIVTTGENLRLQLVRDNRIPPERITSVPQALVQAMCCGLPCVTTAAGGIGEIARDGMTAIVVKAEDVVDLQRGLEKALGDTELCERLGTAARQYCAGNLGVETMLDRMERVFL